MHTNVDWEDSLGADIEAVDYHNETPLHTAAGAFNPQAVQELVTHGANVNAENNMKYTPLTKALSCSRNADIVAYIILLTVLCCYTFYICCDWLCSGIIEIYLSSCASSNSAIIFVKSSRIPSAAYLSNAL